MMIGCLGERPFRIATYSPLIVLKPDYDAKAGYVTLRFLISDKYEIRIELTREKALRLVQQLRSLISEAEEGSD